MADLMRPSISAGEPRNGIGSPNPAPLTLAELGRRLGVLVGRVLADEALNGKTIPASTRILPLHEVSAATEHR